MTKQPEKQDFQPVENDTRPLWRPPVVEYVDLKRTMSGSGSVTDGNFGFTPI